MPLPQRYAAQVPDLVALWAPAGYFAAQTRIWAAQCRAAHELTGAPTAADKPSLFVAGPPKGFEKERETGDLPPDSDEDSKR